MSKFTCTVAAVFLIGIFAASNAAPAATRGASYNTVYNDHYQIIEARNVFVKDRAHIVIRQPGENPGGNNGANGKNVQRNPDEAYVLTGIVREGNGYRAYIENLDSSNVQRLSPGDTLYKGKVGEIDVDAIAYDPAGGQRIWIDIGDDLTGKPSSALSAKAAEESSSAATPDIANINPNDPNLTIEQKMKLRRAQQMGQPLTAAAPGASANGNPTSQPSAAAPNGAVPPPQPAPNAQPVPLPQQQPQPIIVIPPEGFQPSGPQ